MKKSSMKKSSLKNRITLLEAAVSAASNARDYWMREHERRVKALTRLQEKNKIAELKADAAANASDYWARQHELKRRLDEAENEIAELERRLERELIQQPAQFRAHILLKGEANVTQA